jgi:ATP-binding cassette subfamily B protein
MGKGFDTRLGRSFRMGEQLSGGQWQKLALARVFYRDAHLVVLDEPTSALDALAEHALFNELKELAVERIVVLVSHRLYNIKMADRIYVMKNGEIAEEGSFNDLIKKMGLFYNMYEKQKLD